jgi:hypothetical protein
MRRRSFVRQTSVSALASFAFAPLLTGCLGGGSGEDEDGNKTDGGEDEPPEETDISLSDTEFEIIGSGGGTRRDKVSVDTDEKEFTITIEGTLTGNNSCYTAELESAEYDAVEDTFDANVRSFEDRADDEVCAQVITEIEYRLIASFDEGLPGRTVVSHNDELVAEAVSDVDTED